MTVRPYWFLVALVLAVGCAADEPTPENESSELITTLTLHFTPDGGGETLSFSASDPDGTGDLDVEEIPLPDGSDHSHHDSQLYTLEVELLEERIDDLRRQFCGEPEQRADAIDARCELLAIDVAVAVGVELFEQLV